MLHYESMCWIFNVKRLAVELVLLLSFLVFVCMCLLFSELIWYCELLVIYLLILNMWASLQITFLLHQELANLPNLELIQNDGSPCGPKYFLLWNPPLYSTNVSSFYLSIWICFSCSNFVLLLEQSLLTMIMIV